MEREREIIRIMLDTLSEGKAPVQPYFSTDAEHFRFAGKDLLFTTDEFSEEDLFRDHDLCVLGWNLAVASISDIYAAGGTPLFFGHSVSVVSSWDNSRIRDLCSGIASCLVKASISFLGGDLGFSENWHYTGIVIGEMHKPLSRLGARAGESIYMTGTVGNGNLEAAMKLYSNTPALRPILNRFPIRFHLRKAESEVIRKVASCCIDTSDGVLKALQSIADLNGVGFVAEDLPYSREGLFVTRLIGKPHELLFLGESGEYELLFSVSPDREETLLNEAGEKKLLFHKIGYFTESADLWMKERGRIIDLTKFRFSARDFPDAGKYLEILIKTLTDESHKQ